MHPTSSSSPSTINSNATYSFAKSIDPLYTFSIYFFTITLTCYIKTYSVTIAVQIMMMAVKIGVSLFLFELF